MSDSAYSEPMSASLGNFSHAAFIAAEYAVSSVLGSFGGGSAYRRESASISARLASDSGFAFSRAFRTASNASFALSGGKLGLL